MQVAASIELEDSAEVDRLDGGRLAAEIEARTRYLDRGKDSHGEPITIRYCVLGGSGRTNGCAAMAKRTAQGASPLTPPMCTLALERGRAAVVAWQRAAARCRSGGARAFAAVHLSAATIASMLPCPCLDHKQSANPCG